MASTEPPDLYPLNSHVRRDPAHSRLSLPAPLRILIATSASFVLGASLGVSHGSKTAGLVFRAENAHRLPATPTGWYLYHKSKNYHMAMGGVKEGVSPTPLVAC
jgi:hypothetical protein